MSLESLKPEQATEVELEASEISRHGLGQHRQTVFVTTGLLPAKRALNSVFYSAPNEKNTSTQQSAGV